VTGTEEKIYGSAYTKGLEQYSGTEDEFKAELAAIEAQFKKKVQAAKERRAERGLLLLRADGGEQLAPRRRTAAEKEWDRQQGLKGGSRRAEALSLLGAPARRRAEAARPSLAEWNAEFSIPPEEFYGGDYDKALKEYVSRGENAATCTGTATDATAHPSCANDFARSADGSRDDCPAGCDYAESSGGSERDFLALQSWLEHQYYTEALKEHMRQPGATEKGFRAMKDEILNQFKKEVQAAKNAHRRGTDKNKEQAKLQAAEAEAEKAQAAQAARTALSEEDRAALDQQLTSVVEAEEDEGDAAAIEQLVAAGARLVRRPSADFTSLMERVTADGPRSRWAPPEGPLARPRGRRRRRSA